MVLEEAGKSHEQIEKGLRGIRQIISYDVFYYGFPIVFHDFPRQKKKPGHGGSVVRAPAS